MNILPILLQLNITEVTPKDFWDIVAVIAVPVLTALVAGLIGYRSALRAVQQQNEHHEKIERRQKRWQEYQEREQAYVKLHTAIVFTKTAFQMSHENFRVSLPMALRPEYHSILPQLLSNKNSIDLEFVRAIQTFNAGLVEISRRFHPDEEIDRLVYDLAGFGLKISALSGDLPDPGNAEAQRRWNSEQQEGLEALVNSFSSKTGAFCRVMRQRLDEERNELEQEFGSPLKQAPTTRSEGGNTDETTQDTLDP